MLLKATNYYIIIVVITCIGCSDRPTRETTFLKDNLRDFENIRTTLESKYATRIGDSINSRARIVFVDCKVEGMLSAEDYVCDDQWVIKEMNNLDLTEVSFEASPPPFCNKKVRFGELIFYKRTRSFFPGAFYPAVYIKYEYCGTSRYMKSSTIEYIPLDSHWCVYIDSGFP